MIYILVAILAGVSVVVSRSINSNLAIKIGLFQGTFFNYIVGLLFSVLFLLFNKENNNINFSAIPLWAYLGGLVGVVVVVLSSYITPKMSAFYLTLFIFVGQLITGILIDYFNLSTLSIGKVIGGILVLIGLIYNLNLDKISNLQIVKEKAD